MRASLQLGQGYLLYFGKGSEAPFDIYSARLPPFIEESCLLRFPMT